MQGYKLRYKLNTNVSDFTGNRTVPSMDNSNATRVVPSPTNVPYSKIRVLVLQSTIPTVLLYRIEPTTVPTVLRFPLLTTYYLLPTTCYYLIPTTRTRLLPTVQYYLLPTAYSTAYYLLPATCYLLPTTYYLLPATIPAIPTYYLLYLLPTTCYLLHSVLQYSTVPTTVPPTSYLLPTVLQYLLASTDRRRLQLGSWPSLLGRVPPLGLIFDIYFDIYFRTTDAVRVVV